MFIKSLFGIKEPNIEVNFSALELVAPCLKYWESFAGSFREYRAHRVEDFAYPKVDTPEEFSYFLKSVRDRRNGVNLQKGSVPTSMFWLVDGVNYLGSGSVRHFLNDSLKVFGGHIGYSIRPEVWGMGLGTIQLRLLLLEAGKLGIKKARLTCFETNVASQKIMIKNGAYLIDSVVNKINGRDRPTLIYEINLAE